MKTSVFISWVDEYGAAKLARRLGIDRSAVTHWRVGRNCPRPEQMHTIRKLSKGRVTCDHIVDHFREVSRV